VTEADVCEQLAERNGRELNSRPLESQASALTLTPPGHIDIKDKPKGKIWVIWGG